MIAFSGFFQIFQSLNIENIYLVFINKKIHEQIDVNLMNKTTETIFDILKKNLLLKNTLL